MTRAAELPHQKDERLARLSNAVKRNIDALEAKCDELERRIALLEERDAYFRTSFHPYVAALAAAVPFAAPPPLPR